MNFVCCHTHTHTRVSYTFINSEVEHGVVHFMPPFMGSGMVAKGDIGLWVKKKNKRKGGHTERNIYIQFARAAIH